MVGSLVVVKLLLVGSILHVHTIAWPLVDGVHVYVRTYVQASGGKAKKANFILAKDCPPPTHTC